MPVNELSKLLIFLIPFGMIGIVDMFRWSRRIRIANVTREDAKV